MKLLNSKIIHLTICLIFGILIANLANTLSKTTALYIAILFVSSTGSVFFLSHTHKLKKILFGLFSYLAMISIGFLIVFLHDEKNYDNHYLKTNYNDEIITIKIKKILKPDLYNNKYIVDILKIDSTRVTGKALLNIKKDSLSKELNIDNIFIAKTNLKDIPEPLSPYQFDYKKYLVRKYIYKQLYINSNSILKVNQTKRSIYGYANATRKYLILKLETYSFSANELSIIKALILGERQDINKALQTQYINAGVIHILAISGLHIGILLILLNFILKPLIYLKHGKKTKVILIVLTLWSFAIISGLSPSVVRAVTMFSIVAIAMHLKRATNIYNTLAISIFVILLFRPLMIFDIGFQLSYAAVIAIVSIQPLFIKLWNPQHIILKNIWSILSVTISAQLGVLPLSLFYFHQFSGLFFISNLVIIPFLSIILGMGILIIILASFNCLPYFLAKIYETIVSLMNLFVNVISLQKQFIFEDIPFNTLQVISSYIILIAVIRLIYTFNYKSLRMVLYSILIFQSVLIFIKYDTHFNCFIIFHKSKHSIIGQKTNNDLMIYSNLKGITRYKIIKNFSVKNRIIKTDTSSLKSIYTINNNLLLIIDSIPTYRVKTFTPDYLLLRNSPKINLTRVIDSLNPKQIIADGSNYKSFIARWKAICKKQKLPFHYTGEKGAFTIKQ